MPDGSAPQRPTRIAILGSGIAGALAGIALNKLADVEIALFDQASELREVGASIGLQPCAMRCLDYLGMSDEIEQIGYRHGELDHTFRLWSTNEIIPSELRYPLPEYKHQMSRFARSDLHELLISKLPPGSVHLKKKVVAVETPHDGDVRVSFADGTSWAGDGVVGADGIRSAVRQHFVPDYKLDHGHFLSLREVFPRSLLDGIEDVPLGSCHYMGPDLGFFFSPINQDRVTIVAQIPLHLLPPSYANNADRHWAEPADVALLKTLYADWNPTIAAIAARTPAVRVYTDINGPALPSHVFGDGRVVLIGDAGHPHGGAHAAGGTMSVEDAYTLYRALDHVQKSTGARQRGRLDRAALRWAFKTFDTARIGHTTRVIDLANETRRKRQSNAGARVSDDVLRARVATRPDVTILANNDTKAVIERVISENPFDEARNFTVKSQKAGN